MDAFRVYAKLNGLVEGETPEEAKKQATRILTHLLEPKGFEVMGVAVAMGDRIPGKMVTVEDDVAVDSATQVLQWLQTEVFSEEVRLSSPRTVSKTVPGSTDRISLQQYPLVVSVPARGKESAVEATGLISEAPEIMSHDFDLDDPADAEVAQYWKDRGITRKSKGAYMPVPKGQFGYGWHVKAVFPPEGIVALELGQKRILKEIEDTIKHQLSGTPVNVRGAQTPADAEPGETARPGVRHTSNMNVDPATDELVLFMSGLFATPISPDKLYRALNEKIGIRSILPKEVAETDPDAEPAEQPSPVAEQSDIARLLGRLFA